MSGATHGDGASPADLGPGTPHGDPPPRGAAGHGTTRIETPPTAVTVTPSWRVTLAVFAAIVLLLVSFVAPAGAATPRTTLEEVEAELMCVTCRTPLNQSNAPQALEERDQIEKLVAEGRTKQESIDAMVAIYGDPVLIDPPESSLRVARIAVPGAAAVLGISLVVVLIARWRRRARLEDGDGPTDVDARGDGGADLDSSSPALTDDDRRRLDAELERYA